MKRTPIAVVITGPVTDTVRSAVQALTDSRPLDVETWFPASRTGLRGTAQLSATWLRRPRPARPSVVLGIGGAASTIARRTAKIFGARSVAWVGRGISAPHPDTLRALDDVWALDDAAAQDAMVHGVRAYQALLAPSLKQVPVAAHPGPPGRIVVAAAGVLAAPMIDAIQRAGRSAEVAVLGHEDASLLEAWPEASVRFVDEQDEVARQATLTWASGVLVADPEPLHGIVMEALLIGRPLLVPTHRKPPGFTADLGIAFGSTRSEAVADALAELRAASERRRFLPAALRGLAAPYALESRLGEYVERLRALAAR